MATKKISATMLARLIEDRLAKSRAEEKIEREAQRPDAALNRIDQLSAPLPIQSRIVAPPAMQAAREIYSPQRPDMPRQQAPFIAPRQQMPQMRYPPPQRPNVVSPLRQQPPPIGPVGPYGPNMQIHPNQQQRTYQPPNNRFPGAQNHPSNPYLRRRPDY